MIRLPWQCNYYKASPRLLSLTHPLLGGRRAFGLSRRLASQELPLQKPAMPKHQSAMDPAILCTCTLSSLNGRFFCILSVLIAPQPWILMLIQVVDGSEMTMNNAKGDTSVLISIAFANASSNSALERKPSLDAKRQKVALTKSSNSPATTRGIS